MNELLYSYLPFLYAFNKSARLPFNIWTSMVNRIKNHLETNHQNMSFAQLINVVSVLGTFPGKSNMFVGYLENRSEEITKLSFNFLLKILKRGLKLDNFNLKKYYISTILPEFLMIADGEKLTQKSKAFHIALKLNEDFTLDTKLAVQIHNLFMNLLSKIEEFDSITILNMTEALYYYHENDAQKYNFLRDINAMILSTLTSSPDNVKYIFLVRFLEAISKFKKILNKESLDKYFEFIINNDSTFKLGQTFVFIFFDLIRQERYYSNPEIVKMLTTNLIKNKLIRFSDINFDHLESTKVVIKEVLGDEYLKNLSDSFDEKGLYFTSNSKNIQMALDILAVSSLLNTQATKSSTELAETVAKLSKENLPYKKIRNTLNDYIKNNQRYIPQVFKETIVENLIKQINPTDIQKEDFKIFVLLNELHISKKNEAVRKMVTELSNEFLSKNDILSFYSHAVRYGFNDSFGNSSLVKTIIYTRDSINKPEFAKLNDERFLRNFIQVIHNTANHLERKDEIEDSTVASLSSLVDFSVEKNPNLKLNSPVNLVVNTMRALKDRSIRVPNVILRFLYNHLNSTEKTYFTNDVILMFQEIFSSNIISQEERKHIFNKFFVNEGILHFLIILFR